MVEIKRNRIVKLCFILTICCYSSLSFAQKEVEFNIGDTLYFRQCEGENYKYMDLFSKTRWETDTIGYDTLTGEGFYQAFFMTGDFDVARLPCSFRKKFCTISAVQQMSEPGKEPRTVVFATIEKNNKVVWIEVQQAFENDEIGIEP
jgi:hypothetical protein